MAFDVEREQALPVAICVQDWLMADGHFYLDLLPADQLSLALVPSG